MNKQLALKAIKKRLLVLKEELRAKEVCEYSVHLGKVTNKSTNIATLTQ